MPSSNLYPLRCIVPTSIALLPWFLSFVAANAVASARKFPVGRRTPHRSEERLGLSRFGGAVRGSLVFEDGKITQLGPTVQTPKNAEIIDLQGRRVYPGLLDAMSDIGLVEIGSVRATIDNRELAS